MFFIQYNTYMYIYITILDLVKNNNTGQNQVSSCCKMSCGPIPQNYNYLLILLLLLFIDILP